MIASRFFFPFARMDSITCFRYVGRVTNDSILVLSGIRVSRVEDDGQLMAQAKSRLFFKRVVDLIQCWHGEKDKVLEVQFMILASLTDQQPKK